MEAFWQDLTAFDDPVDNVIGEECFLGSIVLVTGGATNDLLDGQQRVEMVRYPGESHVMLLRASRPTC
jgi:hypothetical protein